MSETNQLAIASSALPATMPELAKFVLVGREKLTAVRAEIRAISKVQVAQGVRDQKLEEARMLSEALIDAEVRLGEMTKSIPKAVGGRPQKTTDSGVGSLMDKKTETDNADLRPNDSSVDRLKSKQEIIQDLGFTTKQVERFEKLADNQDLVEIVKVQARENDDIPTRSQVLTMAQARQRKFDSDMKRIDTDYEEVKKLHEAVFGVLCLRNDDSTVQCLIRGLEEDITSTVSDITEAMTKLSQLKTKILFEKGRNSHGKKQISR